MATSSRTSERFKYGICLNDECPQCKAKTVHQIPMRKDLVCPECGKPLRECPPPTSSGKGKLFGIIGAVAAVAVIGGGIALFGGGGSEDTPKDQTVVAVDSDSIKAAQQAAEQQRIQDSLKAAAEKAKEKIKTKEPAADKPKEKKSAGAKDLGYATFKGSWPNDVNGRMIFKSAHIIDSRDSKKRTAEPGDYVIGEFADGHLVQGIWYGADNQVKGSIIIGR